MCCEESYFGHCIREQIFFIFRDISIRKGLSFVEGTRQLYSYAFADCGEKTLISVGFAWCVVESVSVSVMAASDCIALSI